MNLKTGLQNVIKFVEDLEIGTQFNMNDFSDCVIGKLKNHDDSWSNFQGTALNELFGLNLEDTRPSGWPIWWLNTTILDRTIDMDQDTKNVVYLFTTKFCKKDPTNEYYFYNYYISREEWLEEAKKVLESLK